MSFIGRVPLWLGKGGWIIQVPLREKKIDYILSTASNILYKSLTLKRNKTKTPPWSKRTRLRVLREGQLFLTLRKELKLNKIIWYTNWVRKKDGEWNVCHFRDSELSVLRTGIIKEKLGNIHWVLTLRLVLNLHYHLYLIQVFWGRYHCYHHLPHLIKEEIKDPKFELLNKAIKLQSQESNQNLPGH